MTDKSIVDVLQLNKIFFPKYLVADDCCPI